MANNRYIRGSNIRLGAPISNKLGLQDADNLYNRMYSPELKYRKKGNSYRDESFNLDSQINQARMMPSGDQQNYNIAQLYNLKQDLLRHQMNPDKNKFEGGGPVQTQTWLEKNSLPIGGAIGALGSGIAAAMPTDPYGGKSLGSHMIGGAAKGAALGSALGPIGMGVGAAVGAGVGFFGNKAEDALAAQAEMKQRAGMTNAFNLGGYIDPRVNYLGGKWNSYNAMRANRTSNFMADGGMLPMDNNRSFTEYGTGGTHEMNPMGGIQIGMGENGQPNLVEQDETRWNDYIFSDRLKLNNPKAFLLPNRLKDKSFADASKDVMKEAKERPYDAISKRGKDANLARLMGASEQARELEEMKQTGKQPNMFPGGGNLNRMSSWDTPDLDMFNPYGENYLRGSQSMTSMSAGEQAQLQQRSNALGKMNDPKGFNWSQENTADAMRYAPVAFNALAGAMLRKPDQVHLPRRGQELASQYGYEPKYLDETRGLGSINTGYRTALNSLNNVSGGNAAASRAGVIGSTAGYLKGREQLYSTLAGSNLEQYAGAQQMKQNLAMRGAMMDSYADIQEEQINAANQGAFTTNQMNMFGAAAEGIGGIGRENYWGPIVPRMYGYDQRAKYAPQYNKFGGTIKLLKKANRYAGK